MENYNAIPNNYKRRDFKSYLQSLALILLVISIGLFAVNQALEYRYKAVFLQAPCSICKDLNKNQSSCIDKCFTWEKTLYKSPEGDFKDTSGYCYNLNGERISCIKEINLSLK